MEQWDDAILFADLGRVFTFTYVAQGRTGIASHQWYRQPSGAPTDDLSVRRDLEGNLGLRSI